MTTLRTTTPTSANTNNPSSTKSIASIDHKRPITLNHIVTRSFVLDLVSELTVQVTQLTQSVDQFSEVIKDQKSKNAETSQLETEMKKLVVQRKLVSDMLENAKTLKDGEIYTSGSIDGTSTLKKGDDIREQLGTVEVICKDFVVQDIRVTTPTKTQNTQTKAA